MQKAVEKSAAFLWGQSLLRFALYLGLVVQNRIQQ